MCVEFEYDSCFLVLGKKINELLSALQQKSKGYHDVYLKSLYQLARFSHFTVHVGMYMCVCIYVNIHTHI